MAPTRTLQATLVQTAPDLFLHAGDVQKTLRAAKKHSLDPVIWRGPAGTTLVADNLNDPLTSQPAWIDLGGAERGATVNDEAERLTRLVGGQIEVAFAPGFVAKSNDPSALAHWLQVDMPRSQNLLNGLGAATTLVPVVALYEEWLIDPNLRSYAISLLAGVPGPVAVSLMAITNPMHKAGAVVGFVDIVRSCSNIFVIRSDEAAIGLVANGALAGSVGTSSSARFSYLGSAPKVRRPGRRHLVFHMPTMSWIENDRLGAFAVSRRDRRCPCDVCDLRPITRYADLANEIDSIAHSMSCLQMIYDRVMGSVDTAVAWIDECLDAEASSARIARALPQFSDLGSSARAWTGALRPSTP